MAVCASCGETKPFSEFSGNQKTKGGQRKCRVCVSGLPGAAQEQPSATQTTVLTRTNQHQAVTTPSEASRNSVFPSSSPSGMLLCTNCKTKKPSREFSAAQISKGAQKTKGTPLTRRCIVCVHVSEQDQRSAKQPALTSPASTGATKHPEASSMLLCSSCKTTRPSPEFSRSQRTNGSQRRCLVCAFWSSRPTPPTPLQKEVRSGMLLCASCQERKLFLDFAGAQQNKGAQRRCIKCCKQEQLLANPAGGQTPKQHQQATWVPEAKNQEFNWSEDFRLCHSGVSKEQRMRVLRQLIDARVVPGHESSFGSDSLLLGHTRVTVTIADKPSIFMNLGYSKDKAAPEHTPTTPQERAALAKALVDYGEAVEWEKKVGWSCTPLGIPSGPPLSSDLVDIAAEGPLGHSPNSSQLSGAALVATELLQMKGLVYRSDIASCTDDTRQAGSGLWAYRDPPLVKYARAGSTAMVVAMLEAGAPVDQSLMWRESSESWNYTKCYHWRGDSALMAAAREGHAATCAALLHYGASKTHTCCYDDDCYDEGPAAAARRCRHPEIATLIEGHQAGQPVDAGLDALLGEVRRAIQAVGPGAVQHVASRIIIGKA